MRKYERLIGASWSTGKKAQTLGFTSNIVILAQETRLTMFFADVSAIFSDEHVDIEDMKQPNKISNGMYTEFVITALFRNREQLDRVMKKLKALPYVTNVFRK